MLYLLDSKDKQGHLSYQCNWKTVGQQGHLSYQCNKGQGRWQSEPQGGRTPGMCRRCRKGRHYANQCRSRFDKDGNPINHQQGEFQRKAAQSLRHSTACSASSHHTRQISKLYT